MNQSNVFLEHANITVSDLDQSVAFFQTAFPDFIIRGGGGTGVDRWLHLGNETVYLALNQGENRQERTQERYTQNGVNHLGFVVTDVEELAGRMEKAGYERSYPVQKEKFRVRHYFFDKDNNEYEFVQYLSDVPAERNSYA